MNFASLVKETKELAIIRSSYPRHLEEALKKIKELNPQIKTSVIVMPRMASALKDNKLVDEIISLPQDLETYPPLLEREFTQTMQNKKWPLLVILYNKSNQCGYERVEQLVKSFQSQQIWGGTTEGRFFLLSPAYCFSRSLKRWLVRLMFAPLILPLIFFFRFLAGYILWESEK